PAHAHAAADVLGVPMPPSASAVEACESGCRAKARLRWCSLRQPSITVRKENIAIQKMRPGRNGGELKPLHMAVLQFPGPDGVRPSNLAERAGRSKQAMNQLLRSLKGYG